MSKTFFLKFPKDLEVFEFPLLLGELLLCGLDAHDAVGGGRDGDEAAEGVLDRLEPVVAVDAEQVRTGKLESGIFRNKWCHKPKLSCLI